MTKPQCEICNKPMKRNPTGDGAGYLHWEPDCDCQEGEVAGEYTSYERTTNG